MIVKPETAASIADAILDPLPSWRSRGHLAHQGRIEADISDLPYRIASISGKGLGVIATRRIRQFETVMTSFPAIIADNEFFPTERGEGPPEAAQLFQTALDRLTDKRRLLSLAKSRGGDIHVVDDVIRTNAFGVTLGGRDLKGLYPEIAVCNFSLRIPVNTDNQY